ncbi:MAG: histidine ammonia-lyase, partial [Phreatobacter sp.]|nr:histidine ammonia-lyase [Phreatobacter sp.]
HGARRLGPMAENLCRIIGIEALMAAQGVDMRAPLETSPLLAKAHAAIRAVAPVLDADRPLSAEMERAAALVATGGLTTPFGHVVERLFGE